MCVWWLKTTWPRAVAALRQGDVRGQLGHVLRRRRGRRRCGQDGQDAWRRVRTYAWRPPSRSGRSAAPWRPTRRAPGSARGRRPACRRLRRHVPVPRRLNSPASCSRDGVHPAAGERAGHQVLEVGRQLRALHAEQPAVAVGRPLDRARRSPAAAVLTATTVPFTGESIVHPLAARIQRRARARPARRSCRRRAAAADRSAPRAAARSRRCRPSPCRRPRGGPTCGPGGRTAWPAAGSNSRSWSAQLGAATVAGASAARARRDELPEQDEQRQVRHREEVLDRLQPVDGDQVVTHRDFLRP